MRERSIIAQPSVWTGTHQWVHKCPEAGDDPPLTVQGVCTLNGAHISDVLGSRRCKCATVVRQGMNPVTHDKWEVQPSVDALEFVYYADLAWAGLPGCETTLKTSAPYWASVLTGFTDLSSAREWFSTDAEGLSTHYDRWLKAKPSMATRANLAVFLYELRDIKRMFEILPQKHFSLRDWKEVLRYGNNQHLNWNFGWKPFLSDIVKCWDGLTSFESRLHRFLADQNKLLIKHVKDRTVSAHGDTGWINSSQPGYQLRRTWEKNSNCSSTFQFSYTLPPYSYEELRWRAYLDTLGLAATAKNVWAILPWSFVVDWFIGVGDYLQTYSSDWIEPWIYFCQACSSVKTEVRGVISGKFTGYYGYGYVNEWHIANVKLSHYSRAVGCPTYVWNNPGELTADKIRLLASLGLSLII